MSRVRRPSTAQPRLPRDLQPLEPRRLLSSGTLTLGNVFGFGSGLPPVSALTAANGTLLFIADDHVHGQELWRSDGTQLGTVLVKDINSGPADAFRAPVPILAAFTLANVPLVTAGPSTYFAADDGVHGPELWKTDGTPAGTQLVEDLNPGPDGSFPANFLVAGGLLYFTTEDQTHLWRSDGTAANTVQLTAGGVAKGDVSALVAVGNAVFTTFLPRSTDSSLDITGQPGFWKVPTAGAALIPVTTPGDLTLQLARIDAVGGKLLIVSGTTLWSFDAATMVFQKLNTPSSLTGLYPLRVAGGRLFLSAAAAGTVELWVSDGTPVGTHALHAAGSSLHLSSYAAIGNTFFFSTAANSDGSPDLWRSDGTDAGTRKLATTSAAAFASLGALTYFVDGTRLWQTDGTPEGTAPLGTLTAEGLTNFTPFKGILYFPSALTATPGFYAYNPQTSRRRLRRLVALTPDLRLRRGQLRVRGTAAADHVTITADPAAGTLTVNWNDIVTAYPLAGVAGVTVDAANGDDVITLAGPVTRASLFGGDGDDTLTGGDGDDLLHGGFGFDHLRGGAGNDDLFGDDGADELSGGPGADVLSGGGGDGDEADYSDQSRNLVVTLDGKNRDGASGERDNDLPDLEVITGGAGDDYLVSAVDSPFLNYLIGNAGNDTLIGSRGGEPNILYGGVGNDLLVGGPFNDSLIGGLGNDRLDAGPGDDTLFGDAGIDTLLGGPGNDQSDKDKVDARSNIELLTR